VSPQQRKQYNARYYEKNKSRLNAMNQAWAKRHKEELREWRRRYYAENKQRKIELIATLGSTRKFPLECEGCGDVVPTDEMSRYIDGHLFDERCVAFWKRFF